MRRMDQAWRTIPEQQTALAPVYARLLIRQGESWSAASSLLIHALERDPRPELEGDLILCLSRSGHVQAGQERLAAALQRYALDPAGRLAGSARELATGTEAIHGWAGLTRQMTLYAEYLAPANEAVEFQVFRDDGALLDRVRVAAGPDGRAACRFRLPLAQRRQGLRISANGQELLGGARQPTAFGLDGRAHARRGVISGWARLGWAPGLGVRLKIQDEQGGRQRLRAELPMPQSRHGFELKLAGLGLRGGRLLMTALLPDGSEQPLPDSPLLLDSELRQSLKAITPSPASAGKRRHKPLPAPLSIIIPVYKDLERTTACLESVCATVGEGEARIVVVDDASPEPAVSACLDDWAASGRIELLRNPANLGFSGSVNRAMAQHPEDDAILVNSDVVVFPGWWQRLRQAAYGDARIGTVTPLADDDSVAGYSSSLPGAPAEIAQAFDGYVAEAHHGVTLPIPVGVGFCLYIRRECWRQVGPLDQRVFGRGYGEETDFCLRARKLGWRHRLAADVFVHHAGGSSFGTQRPALLERSQDLLNRRHPGFDRSIARFEARNPLLPCRRSLDEAALASRGERIVLLLTTSRGGGVDRYVAERSRQIRAEGLLPLILCPRKFRPDACKILSQDLRLRHLSYSIPGEMPALRQLLRALPIHFIELHHFLSLDPRLVRMLLGLGVGYDAYVHDYSWICPRITLIDHRRSYCGEPALAACERCVARNGSELDEVISVRALRQRSARWLGGAQRVIAPTQDTAQRLVRYFPGLPIEVIPHETFMVAKPWHKPPGATVRIALLGGIGTHKGYQVLLGCARDARRRGLPLEFVVIGYTENDSRLARIGNVFITGPYSEGEVGTLLRRENPHAVFLSSVWPETWSFVLSHAIRSGIPIAAFDVGAIAERLRAEGTGTLLPLAMSAAAINDHLIDTYG